MPVLFLLRVFMPRVPLSCPVRRLLCETVLLLCCAVFLPTSAHADEQEQLWSVHAFGLKVGELSVKAQQSATAFTGNGSFRTTGLAGVLRRIRFSVTSTGQVVGSDIRPTRYDGFSDTGKRVSETSLAFSGAVPRKTAGVQSPAAPIPERAKKGALDPMTMMWLTLRDQSDASLCKLRQTQFDGTRLVRITLQSRVDGEDTVTCSGTYDRIGGYSAEELAELKTSPLSIRYRRAGAVWRADQVHMTTRHGKANLQRRE